jgi:glutamine synthetase
MQRARQFNIEFRVADAAANPYLALALLIDAGLDGVRKARTIDPASAPELPRSLGGALALAERSELVAGCLGAELLSGYLLFKRAEMASVAGLDEGEVCRRYAEVY